MDTYLHGGKGDNIRGAYSIGNDKGGKIIILLTLLAFDLFPGPPKERDVSIAVINYFRADTVFQREYDMVDIITVGVWMQGKFGAYECGDGVVRKGYPTRIRMDYVRGSSGNPCTYFTVFVFVEDSGGWQMYYAPRLYFDDIFQDKAMRGI